MTQIIMYIFVILWCGDMSREGIYIYFSLVCYIGATVFSFYLFFIFKETFQRVSVTCIYIILFHIALYFGSFIYNEPVLPLFGYVVNNPVYISLMYISVYELHKECLR